MKAFSYFFIFFLAIYTVSRFIALGMGYLYVYWIKAYGMPSRLIATYVEYSFYYIPYALSLFLIIRLLLIIKAKRIALPSWYDRWIYKLGLIITSFVLLALLGTIFCLLAYSPGITGVPLGIVLKYSGFIATLIILVCEITSIRSFIKNRNVI